MQNETDRDLPPLLEAKRPHESRQILQNALSFGAFLFAPLQLALMSRALGADGYGRWWWTFGILEAEMLLGMLGADLYIRRTLPARLQGGKSDAAYRCVGAGLSVALALGLGLFILQLAIAPALAEAQRDRELYPYLLILGIQPLLWNLTTILGAALQSATKYVGFAVLRGVVAPVIQIALYGTLWLSKARPASVLVGMSLVTAFILVCAAGLYATEFSWRATAKSLRPTSEIRSLLRFGLPLLAPTLLWSLNGKIDIYFLGAHAGPTELGIYAGCLQVVGILPNIRLVFDPVAQGQVALFSASESWTALSDSLKRLARFCICALLPAFVFLVVLGEPCLAILLGRPTNGTALPLTILACGQLLGSIALASWLVPMLDRGSVLTAIAGGTIAIKCALLYLLVPRWGLMGAAVATAAGTVAAQQGMAVVGALRFRLRIYPPRILYGLAAAAGIGLLGSLGGAWLSARWGAQSLTTWSATLVLLTVLVAAGAWPILERSELGAAASQVGRLLAFKARG